MRVLALWEVSQQRPASQAEAPAPAPAKPSAPQPTPLKVVGGTISAEQAARVERHLEATKGARLHAELRSRGMSQDAIDFWFTPDPSPSGSG